MTHFAQVPNCEHTRVPHYHYFNEAGVLTNCPFAPKQRAIQQPQTANQIRDSIDKHCSSVEELLAAKWSAMIDQSLNSGWTSTGCISSSYTTWHESTHLDRPAKHLQKRPNKTKKAKPAKQDLPVLQQLLKFDSRKVKYCDVCTKMHFGFTPTCPYCGF